MARRRLESYNTTWLGLIAVAVVSVIVGAMLIANAANVNHRHYTALFLQAAALQTGNPITIGGIQVGKVTSMKLAGDHVEAGLEVQDDVALGKDSKAVIKVATILGSRYLALEPEEGGSLPNNTFDLAHTEVPYDLQAALADVTTTYEQVDTDAFAKSLGILGQQMQGLPEVVPQAMRNLQTLSTVIADRRDQLGALLKSTELISTTLERQHANIAAMINQGQELISRFVARSATFHAMMAALTNLVNTMSTTVVANRSELDQTIKNLRQLSDLLAQHDDLLRSTLQAGPPVALRGFANASGTGNAFDFNAPERAGRRLVDVRNQRTGQAVRDDPILQGLQVSARARLLAVVTVVVVAAASAITVALVYFKSTTDHITLTAQFDSAAGLYVDNTVAVLGGMPVGKVTAITPKKSGYVEVQFTVDRDVKIPADAQAVTISTSILTDRQIELTPAVPRRAGAQGPRQHRAAADQDARGVRPRARRVGQDLGLAQGRRQR